MPREELLQLPQGEDGVPAATGTPITPTSAGGVCKWCNGKGHQAEKCRFKKDVEAKEAEIKAKKAEANRKKKSRKQTMKKKKKEGRANRLTRSWNSNWR